LREVTERPEAVHAGTAKVIGTDRSRVESTIRKLLDNRKAFDKMANAVNPYGDGMAAERTVEAIRHYFGFRNNRPQPFCETGGRVIRKKR
jgi:UDP-N-acetylglucosamine 2-epimerase (non-hydrolysing)